MMNDYGAISPPPANNLKEKRHRLMCLPVCFSSSTHPFDVLDDDDYPRTPRMPELRDRCRDLISKIGGHRRRRAASADFSYDAYNYSLNFEDDTSRADNIILRSRLPPSASGSLTPPEKSTTSRHILDDVILEEDVDNRSWRQSAPEKIPNRHSSTSADFSYETSSYALNFEDDSSKTDELGPDNGFMARLPHSPTTNPPAKCSALRPEIAAFS